MPNVSGIINLEKDFSVNHSLLLPYSIQGMERGENGTFQAPAQIKGRREMGLFGC